MHEERATPMMIFMFWYFLASPLPLLLALILPE
jgi:hypothetical protein